MNGYVATAEVAISASPSQVWNALTDPELIAEYFFGTRVRTDWQPGSPITWSGEYDGRPYEDKGEILAVEPGRSLALTHYSPLSGQPDVPESYHRIEYSLEEQGDQVRVVLQQDNNADAAAVQHSEDNWQTMLDGLKEVVERG